MSGRQAEGSRIKKLVMFRILLWWKPDGSEKTHTFHFSLQWKSFRYYVPPIWRQPVMNFKMESRRKAGKSCAAPSTNVLWWKTQHDPGQSLFLSFTESKAWTCRTTYWWNLSGIIKARSPACTHEMCALVHSCSPPGPGRWFGMGSRGQGGEAGESESAEES